MIFTETTIKLEGEEQELFRSKPLYDALKLISTDFIGIIGEGNKVKTILIKEGTSDKTKLELQNKLGELMNG